MGSLPSPPHPPPPPVSVGGPELPAGYRLGKYEVIKRLARGGMAEIYLARAHADLAGFQKVVVIKRILPEFAAEQTFVEMFLDEARLAATLEHANLAQVFDVGAIDGHYFMAMEYLHGEDLRSLVRAAPGHRVPVEHALAIILGVACGLHYAHERVGFDGQPLRIVHRDVSPHNIIVTFDGGVKLLDFGIAKAANQINETRIGTLKGKIPYMSPEQCLGEPLDRRSDIYSLGIVLYELTLGKRLYLGKSDFDVMKDIVEGRVTPPREIDPLYHPTLEEIVMRALDKDRARRFHTVREMQEAIEALIRKARLYVSPLALAQHLEQLFPNKIESWREAQARGQSLLEHIAALPPAEALAGPVSPPRPSPAMQFSASADTRAGDRSRAETPLELPAVREKSGEHEIEVELGSAGTATAPDEKLAPITSLSARLPLARRLGEWRLRLALVALGLVAFGLTRLTLPKKLPRLPPSPVALPARPATPPVPVEPVPPVPLALPPRGDVVVATAPGQIEAEAPPEVPAEPPARRDEGRHHHAHGDAALVIDARPWCNVTLDGVARGPTPLTLKVPPGRHRVVLDNREFDLHRELMVRVAAHATVRRHVDFKRPRRK